jgi:adenylate cyclase
MNKILVVDDEPDLQVLIKQKFRKKIRAKEYEFLFAENGKQALDLLDENQDVDLVLSDINMPIMDGLTLLSQLNETHQLLKSVIVSAYNDMENIRTAMNRGAFDFVTKPINFADLELTMEKTLKHVQQLRETLQAVKENNILKMYVDETVLNFMDSKAFENSIMKSETTDATVLFIDICGFTAISEQEPPDMVVKLLNSYFDVMVKEIIDHNGFVDKFIGDALMSVFRGEYHLDRAIDAALALRAKILELPPIADKLSYKPNVSIGINSGELVSGNIGSISLKRLDYTVIGDVVNTASRLESAANPGQIIISKASYEKVKESFKCNKVGEVSLKNKAKPVVIYEVVE